MSHSLYEVDTREHGGRFVVVPDSMPLISIIPTAEEKLTKELTEPSDRKRVIVTGARRVSSMLVLP